LGWLLTPPAQVTAHGGVAIDTGVTGKYEWLVSIMPYPTFPGAAAVSLLIFDIDLGVPAQNFTGAGYVAAPNDPQPCCQPDLHLGPLPLVIDPVLYPGDYTVYAPLDATGSWEMQFVMERGEERLTVNTTIEVETQPGAPPVDKTAIATQVAMLNAAAAMTGGFGQSPLTTGAPITQPISPLAQPVSPLDVGLGTPLALVASTPTTPISTNSAPATTLVSVNRTWLIWGGLVVVVILGVLLSMARGRSQESE
jgi:hypothetical protein